MAVKVAEDLPAPTVTEVGTVADGLPLESFTTIPPVGAGPDSVTVPVEEEPPVTEVGFKLVETRVAGRIVNGDVWVTVPSVPAMVTAV